MRKTSNSFSKQNSQQPKVFRGGEKKVMKKSLLSLALAGSMLSALAVPAFAATPSDVVGKPVQTAVEELTALGIINGYADGTFKPDNTITRAELAKIVIVATGNESAANLMANTAPSFKDVKKGAWYTGYINAAAAKGFIQGYNGNFRPNDPIKFEEVTAILVRALGYKDKYLSGSWPYNVLLQADEVGLFEGVEMANGTNATRGTVAELTENSLGANLVQYNTDGDLSNVQVKNVDQLLINKLGTSSSEVLTSVALDSDKKIQLATGAVATASNFFITGGKKLTDLLGHTVTVLKNKDGKVLAVTDNQAESNVITTKVNGDQKIDGTILTDASTTAYSTVATPVVYVNTDGVTIDTTVDQLKDDANIQLFLNSDGKAQAILVTNWNSDLQIDDIVAYTTYSIINTEAAGGSYKVDASTSITLDGKAATLADLKASDIIDVVKNKAGLATKVVATRKVVTGKVEATGTTGSDKTVKVSGTTYVTSVDTSKLTLGSEYTFYLNKDGKAVAYTSETAASSGDYAVIYDVDASNYQIILDGQVTAAEYTKVVYYSLKDQKKYTVYTNDAFAKANLKDNSLVELKFDKDTGRIKFATAVESQNSVVLANNNDAKVDSVSSSKLTTKDAASASTSYLLDANTVYLKVTVKGVDSTVTAATAADVKAGDKVTVKAEGATAKFVVITSAGAAAELPGVQGLFVSQSKVTTADGDFYSVKLNVNGEEKTFALDAAIATVGTNDIVTLKDTDASDSNYESAVVTPRTTVIATVPTVNNDLKTIKDGTTTYVATSNTKIYTVNSDNTGLATGSFADVRVAVDTVSNNYGTAKGQYQLVIVASGESYGDNSKEAGVILVVYKNN
ncbi:S-layer homology domain-containing protein [Paenibacillus glycanilyticus]|uniref:S-layer homology domain-containing protein n=1 Tax=Paenibacillus glycanilyticus TaxID=126569 RepID=UPI003EBE1B4E